MKKLLFSAMLVVGMVLGQAQTTIESETNISVQNNEALEITRETSTEIKVNEISLDRYTTISIINADNEGLFNQFKGVKEILSAGPFDVDGTRPSKFRKGKVKKNNPDNIYLSINRSGNIATADVVWSITARNYKKKLIFKGIFVNQGLVEALDAFISL